jgi:translocation and assembly module TamA
MRAFLQQRGYQAPRFTVEADALAVDAGSKSFVRRLAVGGLPPGGDARRLRKIVGEEMTPKTLDRVKSSLVEALQDHGYACPQVAVTADAASGTVFAAVAPGTATVMGAVVPATLKKSDPAVFRRYEAYQVGQPFDMRLFALTSQRIAADSAFVSAYYDVLCGTTGVRIVQRVVEGKPRLTQLGVGFDTEGYAIGKAQWKDSRLDARGSSVEVALYASFRSESAEASLHESPAAGSRFFVKPRLFYDRENQVQFEYVNAEASVLPGTSWDGRSLRVDLAAGPALESIRTVRGPGPAKDTFLAFKTQSAVTDHQFEYYAGEPQSGWRASLDTVSRLSGTDSSFTAHRFSLHGEALWNAGGYSPPLLVVADRWWAGTTYVDDLAVAQQQLAPDMRFFLGGDANLRGASLLGLPGDDAGFLTTVYDGLELRLGDLLRYGFQPLIFLDGAMGGRADVHLDPDVYWSPGAGFRWALPVGSIRGSAARGMTWHRTSQETVSYRPRWQFFLSFGQEF